MKKNAMLKIAAVLLVAVLLTTCAISSTFAKYVTKGAPQTANARAAKWGVTADVELTGGFGKSYINDTDNTIFVTSKANDEILAPGTKGQMVITATVDASEAEVSYEVKYNVTYTNNNGIPLVFKAGGETINNLEDYIKTNLKNNGTVAIDWEWPFYTTDDQDTLDTQLAADQATVTLTVSVDVVQTGGNGAGEPEA